MNQIVKTVALLTTIALHSEAYLACVVTAAEAFAPEETTLAANADGRALSSLRPIRLRCEYLANPLGIDVREPRLSWALETEQNGQTQTAYRIAGALDRGRPLRRFAATAPRVRPARTGRLSASVSLRAGSV